MSPKQDGIRDRDKVYGCFDLNSYLQCSNHMHYSITINNVILYGKSSKCLFSVFLRFKQLCFSIMTRRSRLGCQIIVTKNFEGITVRVPKAHVDIRDL